MNWNRKTRALTSGHDSQQGSRGRRTGFPYRALRCVRGPSSPTRPDVVHDTLEGPDRRLRGTLPQTRVQSQSKEKLSHGGRPHQPSSTKHQPSRVNPKRTTTNFVYVVVLADTSGKDGRPSRVRYVSDEPGALRPPPVPRTTTERVSTKDSRAGGSRRLHRLLLFVRFRPSCMVVRTSRAGRDDPREWTTHVTWTGSLWTEPV